MFPHEDVIMKKYLTLVVLAGALATASFSAMAVQSLTDNTDTSQLKPAGTVSVSRASNLDDLQNKLAEKARQEGAKGFVVNAAGGDNHMYGTATIYK
ncbi:McbA [Enterobacter ludwigii]|uniref:McbA n=3 Tax=Enterobacter ludwigii TaxID=299767 RepID=G8LFY2_9ENTR|nr:McbA [Enterobacter ludwigii]